MPRHRASDYDPGGCLTGYDDPICFGSNGYAFERTPAVAEEYILMLRIRLSQKEKLLSTFRSEDVQELRYSTWWIEGGKRVNGTRVYRRGETGFEGHLRRHTAILHAEVFSMRQSLANYEKRVAEWKPRKRGRN
jgi:hypothetical protein